jgi:hypothetical protein
MIMVCLVAIPSCHIVAHDRKATRRRSAMAQVTAERIFPTARLPSRQIREMLAPLTSLKAISPPHPT